MENFTNETIDLTQLPKYEEVALTPLHREYWKVLLVNLSVLLILFIGALAVFFYVNEEMIRFAPAIATGLGILYIIIVVLTRVGFLRKKYAFREHDTLYRSGVVATNTIIIPYNRIQHVALHEGMVSRWFNLASVEIFTAGGGSSDITIPGIEKDQAERIKQLLMGKIQKQL